MNGDLHFHSTHSDGNKTPQERITQIQILDPENLSYWSVTDHDRWNKEFVWKARDRGIRAIWGIEISAHSHELNTPLHITCYAGKLCQKIGSITDAILRGKEEKIRGQIEKLKGQGFPIEEKEFFAWIHSIGHMQSSTSNWHLSEYLFSAGRKENTLSVLSDLTHGKIRSQFSFLGECLKSNGDFAHIGSISSSRPYLPDLKTLVQIAESEDLILSVAHPNFSFSKFAQRRGAQDKEGKTTVFKQTVADRLIDVGIRNFEINALASPLWVETIASTARKVGGLVTYGSDNHGYDEQSDKKDGKHGLLGRQNPLFPEDMGRRLEKELRRFLIS